MRTIAAMLVIVALTGCAITPEQAEENLRAEEHYQYARSVCDARGLPLNVDCQAGRFACQKHPNNIEKMTAYCVVWRNKLRNPLAIEGRVWRDAARESARENRR